jgi:L-ectoine synthase
VRVSRVDAARSRRGCADVRGVGSDRTSGTRGRSRVAQDGADREVAVIEAARSSPGRLHSTGSAAFRFLHGSPVLDLTGQAVDDHRSPSVVAELRARLIDRLALSRHVELSTVAGDLPATSALIRNHVTFTRFALTCRHDFRSPTSRQLPPPCFPAAARHKPPTAAEPVAAPVCCCWFRVGAFRVTTVLRKTDGLGGNVFVRDLDDVTGTEDDVETPNWRSKRLLLAKHGAGFSVHETTLQANTVNDFWYAHHVEAVFITHGEGELTDQETGKTYLLRPGTAYLLDGHEHHQLRPTTEMRAVCVFNPPLTGREVHDEDGVYPLITDR